MYLDGSGAIRDLRLNGVFVVGSDPIPVGAKLNFAFRLGIENISLQRIATRSQAQQKIGFNLRKYLPRREYTQDCTLPVWL